MPPARQRVRRDPILPASGGMVLALVLAGALAISPAPAAADRPRDAAARPVAVATLGGALGDALQKAFFTPFVAQAHVGIRMTVWDGTLSALQERARVGADPGDRDLVLMDDGAVRLACRQGLLLPLAATWGGAAGGAAGVADAAGRCGRDAVRTTVVLAWDKSRIDAAPGWAEFWDVARRPGRRGLARGPRGTLEIALLADGVPAGEIYGALGSPEGVDRAFRKLDQLKPYIVWWTSPADASRIMQAGAVLMTSAPSGDVQTADLAGHRDFAAQWQGSISTMLSWAMPGRPAAGPPSANGAKGDDRRARAEGDDRRIRAEALLAFMADPARQAAFVALCPTAASPTPGRPPAAPADDGAATPQHLREALRQDEAFWDTHLEALQARFDGWIGKPAGAGPIP